jgi:HD-GYP domain-containing protein (c-di-GMP phosphodiesterase class II)
MPLSLSGGLVAADTKGMRPAWPVLGTIVLGCTLVGVGVWRAPHASFTTLALFLAAAILTEIFEQGDRERSREPTENEPFRLASAAHVAAILLLGPWVAALVAVTGVTAGAFFRAGSLRTVGFRACGAACTTAIAGAAFQLAGGEVGSVELLNGLVPLVALGVTYVTARALLQDVVLRRENFDPRLVVGGGEVGFGAIIGFVATTHPWNVIAVVPVAIALNHVQLQLTRLQRETLRALETFANIVDERDPSTYRHSIRVAGYVDQLARALQLPCSEIDRLRWAGRLHDLGKVAVDSSVLRKAAGLDRQEWAAMRRHPRLSARLLQRFEFVSTQARAVELHHERVDGTGYYGIDAEHLPLAAHFLIVADSFDAMTTDRPYRRGLTKQAGLAEIERNVGTQFHPVVAKAFVAVQRGQDPAAVLTESELAEIRGSTTSYRLGAIAGARDLKERPELVALLGVVLALGGLGLHASWLAASGSLLAVAGLVLRSLARLRSERLTASLRGVLHVADRATLFTELVARLTRAWPITWAALVEWHEDGLGGTIERSSGAGPTESAVSSWLLREAESGREVIVAPGVELGREGIEVALPLRRETSALVGFLVLEAPRLPARYVELALLELLDDIGLALAATPASGGGGREDSEALEAAADASDLVVARLDQR